MDEMKLHAVDGSGNPLEPRNYVVPIIREIFPGCLEIVGTGFYISRYGLFLTAYHVLKTLIDNKKRILNVGYICHQGMDCDIYLRRIRQANFFPSVDLAVGQADNYSNKYPTNALINKRVQLAAKVPAPDSVVFTYAYPENKRLDFTIENHIPVVFSDFFVGKFIRNVVNSEHPLMPFSHFETSIKIKSGASGGPVFDSDGRVVGVNCRGWDFGDAAPEEDNFSLIIPVREVLNQRVKLDHLPPVSWERDQIPTNRVGTTFTIAELAGYGHIDFNLGFEALSPSSRIRHDGNHPESRIMPSSCL